MAPESASRRFHLPTIQRGVRTYDHAEVTGFLANRVVLEALSGIAWRRRALAADPARPARRPESPLLEGR